MQQLRESHTNQCLIYHQLYYLPNQEECKLGMMQVHASSFHLQPLNFSCHVAQVEIPLDIIFTVYYGQNIKLYVRQAPTINCTALLGDGT